MLFIRRVRFLSRMNHALEQEKKTLVERNALLTRQLFDKAEEVSRLNAEINGMIETNGKLKRDLNRESVQKEELDKLLCEAQRRYVCPEDCAHRANPGPGGSVCRNCIRNPHAVDKYEGGTR